MHRNDDSIRPEEILLKRGFRPEHLTPRERQELAERLHSELEFAVSAGVHGSEARTSAAAALNLSDDRARRGGTHGSAP